MATSAFKSTSRRGNYANASTSLSSSSTSTRDQHVSRDSVKKNPIRRSRSLSAVRRSSEPLQEEYGNTRDNPLFDCSSGSSKSSSSDKEKLGIGKGKGDEVGIGTRARTGRALGSVVKPPERSLSRVDPVRRRLRSVSRGPSKSIESGYPSTDTDDGIIVETVRSEVQRAVFQIRDDLENVIKGRSTKDMLSDSDGTEIASDFRTDYASKLEQSQERICKLRAQLAVEEQRKEELNKILKEVLSSPDSSGSCQTRSRRRSSIERHEASRRLEEEAMSYFEECISISNFDGSDISSLEDHLPSSAASRRKLENDAFLSNEEIAFAESLISNNYEESENQSPRSVSLTGSDNAFSHSSSYAKYPNPKPIYSNDLISDFDAPNESSRFSFTEQPDKHTERNNGSYLENFGKGCDEERLVCLKSTRPRYYADDYMSKSSDETLLQDMVMCKARLDSGGLLLCNIRTF